MMDAIGKPDLLHVLFEGLPFSIFLVALVVSIYVLADSTNLKVVFTVLVPKNVATPESSLR